MIAVEDLSITLGSFSLEGVSFEVPTGQYGVLMGKTGCGKTTILECLCGLKHPHAGRIALMGREVTRLKPGERGIGYVPQDLALFARMTVRENLAFSLRARKWTPKAIAERVEELSSLLGIPHLLGRKPKGLSGGESQRVALGRALACRPTTLCLDEPLSALDDETKAEMYTLIQSVQRHTGVTALHVTHSLGEARVLADRIYRLEEGCIEAEEVEAKADRRPNERRRQRVERDGPPRPVADSAG